MGASIEPLLVTGLAFAFAAAGVAAALFALYQLTLAVAASRHSGTPDAGTGQAPRVVVLVPAHDEELHVARCVTSLRRQAYPRDRMEVVVVADNCSDDTARCAARAGARVLVREEPHARGKGHALRWGMDRLLPEQPAPDAIAVVDADAIVAPDFLTLLTRPLVAGAEAVQGESLLMEDGTGRTALRVAAFLLCNRVRPAGRAALRLSCNLTGTGMLLSSRLLRTMPWESYTSAEDLEHTLRLRDADVRIALARGAVVLSAAAPNAAAAAAQQARWEGGKAHLARAWMPRLLSEGLRRRPQLLETALDLALPPLGLLAGATLAGSVAGCALALAGVLPAWPLVPWATASIALPLYVLVGLHVAEAPASAYRALRAAPLFVLSKMVHAPRLLFFHADSWIRTERAGQAAE